MSNDELAELKRIEEALAGLIATLYEDEVSFDATLPTLVRLQTIVEYLTGMS